MLSPCIAVDVMPNCNEHKFTVGSGGLKLTKCPGSG